MYLDHSATTPVRPEVLEAMWPFFSQVSGNPSSVHSYGGPAREALLRARHAVAPVLECRPGELVFTSGGTESDNLAILGCARAQRARGAHVITSMIEHEAILNACRQLEREGFRVTYLPVNSEGFVAPEDVESALCDDTILVSIMLANNEVGTLEPVGEIGRLVRRRGVVMHTDAVQGAGLLDIDVNRLNVDLLSISAHKIYGPKGVGALYVRRGTPLVPLVYGGGQEKDRRSGTENVPGCVGLAVALALAQAEREGEAGRLSLLRDQLIEGVLASVSGARLTGSRDFRMPGHASFYLEGVSGESVLVNLDMAGIACASGSACQAGSTDPSHVLLALGVPPTLARNALRMTLGRENTESDVQHVLEVLPGIVHEMQEGSRAQLDSSTVIA